MYEKVHMTKMPKNELLDALTDYGYELRKPLRRYKPVDVLLNLVNQDDSRLLEGFPVAYENMLSQKDLDWHSHKDVLGKELSGGPRKKLFYLLLLSYLLFKLYGEDESKLKETEYALENMSAQWKDQLKDLERRFNNSDPVKVDDKVELSTERLKTQFRNYVVHGAPKGGKELGMDMEVDVLLSEFFTDKQKELLKKRRRGEVLSKTEREYFYRVVSKRLKALRNESLHGFVKSFGG